VDKTAASAALLAKCVLLHAYSSTVYLLIQVPCTFLVINYEQIKNKWCWKSLKS